MHTTVLHDLQVSWKHTYRGPIIGRFSTTGGVSDPNPSVVQVSTVLTIPSAGKNVKQLEFLYITGGNEK